MKSHNGLAMLIMDDNIYLDKSELPSTKDVESKNGIDYFANAQAEIICNFSEWHKLYGIEFALASIFIVKTAWKSVA